MSTTKAAEAHGGGQVIRAWRRRRKLTQKELAARTGYTPGDIRALERGEVALAARAIKKIGAALVAVESRDLEHEIAWANLQKVRQALLGELSFETLSASWDVLTHKLKPLFLEVAERFLREERLQARRKGSKP